MAPLTFSQSNLKPTYHTCLELKENAKWQFSGWGSISMPQRNLKVCTRVLRCKTTHACVRPLCFFSLPCPSFPLCFWKMARKTHQKDKVFCLYRTPKIPGKEGKNARKNKEFLTGRKARNSKRARKGRTG